MPRGDAWLRQQGPACARLHDAIAQHLGSLGLVLDRELAREHIPGIVVCDVIDDALLERLDSWRQNGSARLLVVVSTRASLEGGRLWPLMQAGATDVLAWDALSDPLAAVAARVRRWIEIDRVVESPAVRERLVGASGIWKAAIRQVVELALHTDSPLLITGQSGTGKELVAQLVHQLSARQPAGEFVLLDCSTIVADLSGSEFFGHERGAFTGAYAARDGVFAHADGGTLFLDEVGELPTPLQAALLRVVQEGTYKRVGGNEWKNVRFRLVCATHRNLEADRARGGFRDDFYFRLAGGICRLPSLDERREDIPLLARSFLRELLGPDAPELDEAVRAFLVCRSYPGNVRELRQLVARMASRYVPPGPLTVGAIPDLERAAAPIAQGADARCLELAIRVALARGQGVEDIRRAAATIAYRIVLDEEQGDTANSSRRLKVSTRAVQMYLRNRQDESTGSVLRPSGAVDGDAERGSDNVASNSACLEIPVNAHGISP